MDGVLHLMDVEGGQFVALGDELARVSGHTHVKAELKIPEARVNNFTVRPLAEVDARNGVTRGEVTRIDPAAIDGTALVDLRLPGELPRGVRPSLSVREMIELQRLVSVLHVGRPIRARE